MTIALSAEARPIPDLDGRGQDRYYGRIRPEDPDFEVASYKNVTLWSCVHLHYTEEAALACAKRELRRRAKD